MASFLGSDKFFTTDNHFGLAEKWQTVSRKIANRGLFDLALSLLVGAIAGALLIFSWDLSSSWQGIILVIPIAITFVLLTNDIEKVVLAAIALSVPLNLDISLAISPYARNPENLAMGHRTLVTLTEMRLSLVTILILIGYGLWLISNRRTSIHFSAVNTIPVVGLIFVSVISVIKAQDLQLVSFQIMQMVELFLMYLYIINHLRTIEDLQFFLTVSTLGMLVEAVLMVVQWFTGLEFYVAGIQATASLNRVAGTLDNEGPAGGYISAHLMVALVGIWAFPKLPQKLMAIAAVFVGMPALVATGSRAGWLGFAVALLIFIGVAFWRGWVSRKALFGLLLIMLVVAAALYQPVYTRLTEDDRGSAESRPKMYRLAWNVIQDNMWLGVGANNYALVAKDYYTADVGDLGYVVNSIVHNRYLAVWAETGLFGLIFFVAFLLMPVIQMMRCVFRPRSLFENLVALGLSCAIISLCIQMMTGTFHTRPINFFVWILVGLMATLQILKQTVLPSNQPRILEKSLVSAADALSSPIQEPRPNFERTIDSLISRL